MKYTYIIFIFLINSILFSNQVKPIYEQNKTAEAYYKAELYEDAIYSYKKILNFKEEILGFNHKDLIPTLYALSNIHLLLSDIETSEEFLKRALNIQYNDFLKEQVNYITTFTKIKNIYTVIEDSTKINELDSIITILSMLQSDSIVYQLDSTIYYPDIIHFQTTSIDSSKLVSSYTNNDKAIDFFNQGAVFLEKGLFTEAIKSFDHGLQLNADAIDKDYLLNFNFSDDMIVNQFIESLNEVTLHDSTIVADQLLLGLINIQLLGDINKTSNLINEYIKNRPNDSRAYLLLGDIYFQQSDFMNALSYFYRINLLNPKQLESQLHAGISMFHLGQYYDAIEKFEQTIMLDKYNGKAKYYMGLSYLKLNQYKEAIEYITESLLLNHSNDEVYYSLGIAYNKNNQKMQALESFKQATKINSDNGLAHFELGNIYESILKIDLALTEYKDAREYINNDVLNIKYGTLLFNNKMYKKAMAPLRDYIINNPYNDTVLTYLGEIFISENRFPEAIDTYNRLIDLNPYYNNYYKKIAESYYSLGNYKASKEYYNKLLKFNTENTEILLMLGDISNKLYEFKESEKFLLEAMACDLISENLLFELGIAYGGQKKYLQAAQAFKDAMKYTENDNPILFFQLGVVYQELLLHDLAINEFTKFLDYHSDDSMVNTMMGESYQSINKFQEAISYYEKALKNKNSTNIINIYYQIGMCYSGLNQNNNAAKYFKRSLKVNPDYALSRYQLINLYLTLNKKKEAKKECDILFMLDRDLYNSSTYCTSL